MGDEEGNLSTCSIQKQVGQRATDPLLFMCMPFKITTFLAGVPLNMKESPGEDSFPIVCMHEGDIEIELRREAEKARQGY